MQNSHNLNILTNSLSNDSSRGFTNNVLDKNKLGVEQLKKIEILLKKVNEAMIDINSVINSKESPISSNDDTLDGGAMDNDIKAPDNIYDNSEAKELEFESLPVQEDQNQAFILSDDNANNMKEAAAICLNKVSKISDAAILFLAKCTELLTELTSLCRKNNDINDSGALPVDNQDANLADDEQVEPAASLENEIDVNAPIAQPAAEASEVQANPQLEKMETEIDTNAQAQLESLDQKDETGAQALQPDAESSAAQADEQVEQIPFEAYAKELMIKLEPDSLEAQIDEPAAILQGHIDTNAQTQVDSNQQAEPAQPLEQQVVLLEQMEQAQPEPLEQIEQIVDNEQLPVQGQDVSSIFSNTDLS